MEEIARLQEETVFDALCEFKKIDFDRRNFFWRVLTHGKILKNEKNYRTR